MVLTGNLVTPDSELDSKCQYAHYHDIDVHLVLSIQNVGCPAKSKAVGLETSFRESFTGLQYLISIKYQTP